LVAREVEIEKGGNIACSFRVGFSTH
jgi:hypothetical protein